LDRRISDLTDRVATLEVRPAPDNDADGSNDDDLEVYDADRNIDNQATLQNKLRRRLERNTRGMGGQHHHHHTIEVTVIELPMTLMLRLSLLYLLLMDIMMLRPILIGR
jgi:hypothetical protein